MANNYANIYLPYSKGKIFQLVAHYSSITNKPGIVVKKNISFPFVIVGWPGSYIDETFISESSALRHVFKIYSNLDWKNRSQMSASGTSGTSGTSYRTKKIDCNFSVVRLSEITAGQSNAPTRKETLTRVLDHFTTLHKCLSIDLNINPANVDENMKPKLSKLFDSLGKVEEEINYLLNKTRVEIKNEGTFDSERTLEEILEETLTDETTLTDEELKKFDDKVKSIIERHFEIFLQIIELYTKYHYGDGTYKADETLFQLIPEKTRQKTGLKLVDVVEVFQPATLNPTLSQKLKRRQTAFNLFLTTTPGRRISLAEFGFLITEKIIKPLSKIQSKNTKWTHFQLIELQSNGQDKLFNSIPLVYNLTEQINGDWALSVSSDLRVKIKIQSAISSSQYGIQIAGVPADIRFDLMHSSEGMNELRLACEDIENLFIDPVLLSSDICLQFLLIQNATKLAYQSPFAEITSVNVAGYVTAHSRTLQTKKTKENSAKTKLEKLEKKEPVSLKPRRRQ